MFIIPPAAAGAAAGAPAGAGVGAGAGAGAGDLLNSLGLSWPVSERRKYLSKPEID